MTGEEARRHREERLKERLEHLEKRKESLERLNNSENRPPSREEIEERERQKIARSEDRRPLMLVLLFSVLLFYKVIGSDEPGDWIPWPVGILTGASLAYVAFRSLGWRRTAARLVWSSCLVGFVMVPLGTSLLLGLPIFPPPLPTDIPTPANVVYAAVDGLLLGAGLIAVRDTGDSRTKIPGPDNFGLQKNRLNKGPEGPSAPPRTRKYPC